MLEIIYVILAIALASLLLGTGLPSINSNAGLRRATTVLADSGFHTLDLAAVSYRLSHGRAPVAPTEGGPPSALIPAYSETPMTPAGMGWSYGSANPGHSLWVCLSGTVASLDEWAGLAAAQRLRPSGTAAFDVACRVPEPSDGTVPPEPPEAFPASAALTYQVFN
jgi:hypothetical protein